MSEGTVLIETRFQGPPTSGNGGYLGELAVALDGDVAVGEPCVVVGWETERDGRKHHAGTAIYDASGACRGVGRAIWLEAARPLT